MKLIDENGRIFGKVNLLDFIAIIVVLALVLLTFFKMFNKQLSDITSQEELVKVQVKFQVVGDKGYFDVVQVGDKLGEGKKYLDGSVIDVDLLPVEVTNLDAEGNVVVSEDPLQEKAVITIEATVPYEDYCYKLGTQELRQGKTIFLESDLYKYMAQIISIKVVE
ncbi:MAG: DUF4330 domain-containing protein [Tissierellia bacterium]|nr:DUF4330 domain-containing protein [Tissierellia bacterium]